MNILFYSRKGGQGKTTHAISYALYAKAVCHTNDYDNSTIEIFGSLFKDGKLREIHPGDKIEIEEGSNNVFDFGGFLDKRVINVAKFVDYCVVPIRYESKTDLTPAVQTIIELEKYNQNIIILINNTDKDYVDGVKDALSKKFKHKIFVVNKSKYIHRLSDENKTLFDLFNKGGLGKYQLKNLITQIKNFYNYLK